MTPRSFAPAAPANATARRNVAAIRAAARTAAADRALCRAPSVDRSRALRLKDFPLKLFSLLIGGAGLLAAPAAAQMAIPGMTMPMPAKPAAKKPATKKAVAKTTTSKQSVAKKSSAKSAPAKKSAPATSSEQHGGMGGMTMPMEHGGAQPTQSQPMQPGMTMPTGQGGAQPSAQPMPMDHSQTDHSQMGGMGMAMGEHAGHGMAMNAALGRYPMEREASGTAWNPDASEHMGLMKMSGDWMLMAHGVVNFVTDHQSGPRG